MASYVRSLTVWYGYLVVGIGDASTRLFYEDPSTREITEVCSEFIESGEKIEALQVWQPTGEDEVLLAAGTSSAYFALWRLSSNPKPTSGQAPRPKMEVIKKFRCNNLDTVRLCVYENRLFVANGSKISELNSKGEEINVFTINGGSVSRITAWGDYLAVACFRGAKGPSLYTPTGILVDQLVIPGETDSFTTRYVHNFNDEFLVVGCDLDYHIYVYDTQRKLVAKDRINGGIFGVAQKGATRFVTADGGNQVIHWELKRNVEDGTVVLKKLQTFSLSSTQMYSCCWWNGRLYAGNYDGVIYIWK